VLSDSIAGFVMAQATFGFPQLELSKRAVRP